MAPANRLECHSMSYASYDRLTALDSTFLDLESPNVHMHVG